MKQRSFKEKEITCGGCGKKFTRTSNRQWWCSRSCADKCKRRVAREERKLHPSYHRVCGYCKKEFDTGLSKKTFCTIEHKEKFYNEIQKKLGLRNVYRQGKLCSGKWHETLQQAEYSCQVCGLSSTTSKSDGLVVHHLDGNGAYMNIPNNDLDNLMVVCRKCHKMFHGLSLVLREGEWKIKSDFLRLLGWHSIGVL